MTKEIETIQKRNKKKEKRLNIFIQKQLKKDERILLFKKLKDLKFDKNLLKSSKKLGKMSKREKLALSLNQEKAGIELTEDVTLYHDITMDEFNYTNVGDGITETIASKMNDTTETTVDGIENVNGNPKTIVSNGITETIVSNMDGITERTADGIKENENIVNGIERANESEKSLIERAFGGQKRPNPVVYESNPHGNTCIVEHDITVRKIKKRKKNKKKIKETVHEPEMTIHENIEKNTNETLETPIVPDTMHNNQPAYYVSVERDPAIQIARLALPVVGEEQPIMETIMHNNVTILCGETGSGKTTQVPQFLYEAGFGDKNHPKFPGMIGITQPRRVAAVSMANRVAQELNLHDGQVAYQIRYDKSNLGKDTRIKFMTDGILLRELSSTITDKSNNGDLLLSQYSCIIIDEAHERTVGTDILIGWLTRIIRLRNSGKIKGIGPLKLVIMSATLRVEDFTQNTKLFPPEINHSPPPVIKVDGRQHKVVIHYNKKTPELDYIAQVLKKIVKIHTRLPHGGILAFVTGQQEVQILCKKLAQLFPLPGVKANVSQHDSVVKSDIFEKDTDESQIEENIADYKILDDYDNQFNSSDDDEEEQIQVLDGTVEEDVDLELPKQPSSTKMPLFVLPLYSLLSTRDQLRVFDPPPDGSRLVVIATNVAETSLTIPGIRYVVDSGKVKEKYYDTQTGIQNFRVGWTSSASADQRAGRAGRLGPGHCYRIYSSTVYSNFFPKFTKPEILRIPIEGVVLSMKSMGINQVVNFPFPTPPNQNNLKDAEKLLLNLEALDQDLKITKLGKFMAQFPVNPRYAKIIVFASKQSPDLLLYVIAIVSGLSVGEIFHRDLDLLIDKNADEDEDEDAKEERKQKRGNFYKKMQVLFHLTKLFSTSSPKSDCLTILRAIGAYISELSISRNQIEDFCRFHYLRPKAMEEVLKLMSQLIQLAKSCIGVNIEFNNRLQPPTSEQEGLILQVLLSGYGDCVAKLDESLMSGYGSNALPVYQTIWSSVEERFVIHPSSSIFRSRPCPKWIIFDQVQSKQENLGVEGDLIVQRISQDGTERKWMKIVSSIDVKWLNSLCKPQVNQGSLLTLPEPRYVPEEDSVIGFISPTFGPKFWELPVCEVTLAKEEAVPWFARALLEGQITSPSSSKDLFKLLCGYLETKPSAVTKSWAKGQPRVINLLNELALADIYTKSSLLQKWKAEPKYLLSSYLLWVPSILHDKICELWPPCKLINGNCQINIKLVNELETILEKVQC